MADKSHSLETDWARAPPPSGPLWLRMAKAIYNPDEHSFLGRTPKRWGIMLIFYTVFYAVLALLFAACMGGLFLTLDPKKPTYTLADSLIGNNPGVNARPQALVSDEIHYNSSDQKSYQPYVDQLKEFFIPYENSRLIISEQCTEADNFGYPSTPCFAIKLNKIIGWKPECYDDVLNLPAEMPEDLKSYIKGLDVSKLKQIWVSCWEEKSNGTMFEYPWGRGLDAARFPYTNADGYVSPFVVVRITPPVDEQLVFRCRYWAKNIIYNKSKKEASGYTRAKLLIDGSAPAKDKAADN